MLNFIEYVVSELKNGRLSKGNALDLIKQYSHKSANNQENLVLHPLLHSNISDLERQAYCSTFSGEEFFLQDHQIKITSGKRKLIHRVLPGVAYLEMVREAVRRATVSQQATDYLELQNTVWIQPAILTEPKVFTTTLFSADDEQDQLNSINFEVSSSGEQEIIHCCGQAVYRSNASSLQLDIEKLSSQMKQGRLDADSIYNAFAQMGFKYGPTFQGVEAIYLGEGQLLATLKMPAAIKENARKYLLHPSLLDSALQASIGFIENLAVLPESPSIPFALDSLRIFNDCNRDMYAWIRHSSNNSGDKTSKLNIDLIDAEGNICVQMLGFSTRKETAKLEQLNIQDKSDEVLFASPEWQDKEVIISDLGYKTVFSARYILLCDMPTINQHELTMQFSNCSSLPLESSAKDNLAQRYSSIATACFGELKTMLESRPEGNLLLQLVVADTKDSVILTGLSGLLKSAMLEFPQFTGQIILAKPTISTKDLIQQLQDNQYRPKDAIVRYHKGIRQRLGWQKQSTSECLPPVAFKEKGVYLITGGLGKIGTLIAKEILQQTDNVRIILTGRTPLEQAEWAKKKRTILLENTDKVDQLYYKQLDVTELEQVKKLITFVKEEHQQLNGIIHSAGIISDNFIVKKSSEEFNRVLGPKVLGTYNLDEATKEVELDFLMLFSSVSSVFGNIGQADYAVANGFMDQFVSYRNDRVKRRECYGSTLSFNWPLWLEGGMNVNQATLENLRKTTGMAPMKTETGLVAIYRSLNLHSAQTLVMEGDLTKFEHFLFEDAVQDSKQLHPKPLIGDTTSYDLSERTQSYIKNELSQLLKLSSHQIDSQAPLEKYGIDSILAMELTKKLEETFGSLSKTLFFEYQTIAELSGYFINNHSSQLAEIFAIGNQSTSENIADVPTTKPVINKTPSATERVRNRLKKRFTTNKIENEHVAIIGLSGRYPEAYSLDEFWHNLRDGKDCIVEVPKERWDWQDYLSSDRNLSGYHYSKWGGFIEGVDEFDSLFFNISPLEAESIDPQERLFLQHAWMAVEDAGYTRNSLQVTNEQDLPGQVGVYVGVMYSEYQLFGAEASVKGKRVGVPGSYASIANRVSYVLNLHGPSMAIDTMCSSSLASIHLACQDLKLGRTSMAIAGGVNVSIHPSKYLVLSAGQFISSEGHCQSFGEGGEGYIPGEGVGVVVLKRLKEAINDGDPIYGIIRGSTLNHGGKTNGYTVPNPRAQSNAITNALRDAEITARHVSYIEAHGTGTKLGDPIEIAALSQAFDQNSTVEYDASQRVKCLIGSVKSNIGHCESAAGIAGLSKVLLQMKHKKIVPSLHSSKLNPHIDFEQSPFEVNQGLKDWQQPIINGKVIPRIAGISSFGAGGSNAHLIVEEYQATETDELSNLNDAGLSKVMIILSARTKEQLRQKVSDLIEFVIDIQKTSETANKHLDLVAIAYTLQVGRESMDERLGLTVSSAEQLIDTLRSYLNGEQDIDALYYGKLKRGADGMTTISRDDDMKEAIDKWIVRKKYSKLLDLWVKGLELDWNKFYDEAKPKRISLPSYPFAKNRYWLDLGFNGVESNSSKVIHPLVHKNTSDFKQQSYSVAFSGEEFFLKDHEVIINNEAKKVLPAVAYLEMVRAALEQAIPDQESIFNLSLHNTVWIQPIVVTKNKEINIALNINAQNQIDYEIYSIEDNNEVLHCQGLAILGSHLSTSKFDTDQLVAQMNKGVLQTDVIYDAFKKMGIHYGAAYQGITAVYQGSDELLAKISISSSIQDKLDEYILHPTMMDCSIQASIGLRDNIGQLPQKPVIPFALDKLTIASPCTSEMFAWIRFSQTENLDRKLDKLDIDLIDVEGNVCVQMKGLTSRAFGTSINTNNTSIEKKAVEQLFTCPEWIFETNNQTADEAVLMDIDRHVILFNMSNVDRERIESALSCNQLTYMESSFDNSIASLYSDIALKCFKIVKDIFLKKPTKTTLIQLVVSDNALGFLLVGLSGLLKTAGLENPLIIGQLILANENITTNELVEKIQLEAFSLSNSTVKLANNDRQVLRFKKISLENETPQLTIKNNGTYIITGGLGGLGLIFAKEILDTTTEARVILTGRAQISSDIQQKLGQFEDAKQRVEYCQLDINSQNSTSKLFSELSKKYKSINGIIHSAGTTQDNFILQKSRHEFSQVLIPKVVGTYHIDQASQNLKLDFMVLFSSVSGVMGNLGQADYAAANGFMDQFASYRNDLVEKNERYGHTLSINWPLWQDGGMSLDQSSQDMLKKVIGAHPMRTQTGIRAFHASLGAGLTQSMILEGDIEKLGKVFIPEEPLLRDFSASGESAKLGIQSNGIDSKFDANIDNVVLEETKSFLAKQLATLLKMNAFEIDADAPLEDYGIDSVLTMKLTNQLETTFGSLSKTLFFEYQTITELAGYFIRNHFELIQQQIGNASRVVNLSTSKKQSNVEIPVRSLARVSKRFFNENSKERKEIAIIGVSGKYPQANNLDEFWINLKEGRDCITEIPQERWNHQLYFDPKQNQIGKSYSKWGGFIDDVDKFDSLFFNISPKEASLIDPQERLFIETAWQTIEDAGYSKESLSGKKIGVYVGVMYGQYEMYGAQMLSSGSGSIPGSSFASIANRVSYFFNFNGPSLALDTMCSSSLTAIHLACEGLRQGEVDAAIAGGVNVSVHPYKYINLSQGNFLASDGRCRSFGEGGDGYVPGEGVGAILLKSLDKALGDGDSIHALVKASSINHGGKTNGYTVPNPNAQAQLILDTLAKADISPTSLNYIEAHGTGTSLGDPIEITGLKKAFDNFTSEKQFCSIGSVKSNIGHLESAAGIAAVTKVLLQIKYRQLVPSLFSTSLNSNINFEESPFYVQNKLSNWNALNESPRRAAISSFGAGGSNSHLILEEYIDSREYSLSTGLTEVFIISAETDERLYVYAEKYLKFIDENLDISFSEMIYTLQIGRTSMNSRLAIICKNIDELKVRLNKWIAFKCDNTELKHSEVDIEGVFSGNIKQNKSTIGSLIKGEAGKAFLQVTLDNRDLKQLAKLWSLGIGIDWSFLYQNKNFKRLSIPTYPFAKERHWVESGSYRERESNGPLAHNNRALRNIPESTDNNRDEKKLVHLKTYWQTVSLDYYGDSAPLKGTLLLLDENTELFLALQKRLSAGKHQVPIVFVRAGSAYRKTGSNQYMINAGSYADYEKLVNELRIKNTLPQFLIQNSGYSDYSIELTGTNENSLPTEKLDKGIYSLLRLTRALLKEKNQTQLNILSISFATSNHSKPENVAMSAFLKTLNLEKPKYKSKVISFHNSPVLRQLNLDETAEAILTEFKDEQWSSVEISYNLESNGHFKRPTRKVKKLMRQAPILSDRGRLPLKQNGVYLITGGLGGLGAIYCEHLAKEYNANLIIIGRTIINDLIESKIDQLRKYGANVQYFAVDVSKALELKAVMHQARLEFPQINGIIHSAGVKSDSFILNKEESEMDIVIGVKALGAINLDEVFKTENLDFFVLFSSISGVTGTLGQCDYAYANQFLDSFAEHRNSLVQCGKRRGKTLSINWPFWEEGGMRISDSNLSLIEEQTGMSPLPSKLGIQAFENLLVSDLPQGIVLYGVAPKIEVHLIRESSQLTTNQLKSSNILTSSMLLNRTEAYLKELISDEIKLPPEKIDVDERFESFGIDSVMVNQFNINLERDLGALPKTLLYEYETIEELAKYLVNEIGNDLVALFRLESIEGQPHGQSCEILDHPSLSNNYENVLQGKEFVKVVEKIAIIGVDGCYPQSSNMDEYWENLKQGKDLIELVPANRWDREDFYSPLPEHAEKGKIYCKWGGFLEDFDKFDPLFFNISCEEAKMIDPQERLFLGSVWNSIEDAGYTRESLRKQFPKGKSADVGVFVGVTTNSYHLLSGEEWGNGNTVSPGSLPWSIANRVSYFFNFQGPSMPVDTACSSSLVAIHLACESLKNRECQIAIAGGVNLYLHPSKYHSLCQRKMLSRTGKCFSYGGGDDGFVPGEGVGTVVLKPLSKAIEHEDIIHAVISTSAFEHSGRSSGYSAPNPNSQASLIINALEKGKVSPNSIGYIEGHGTGTQLGDSLEIAALTNAFRSHTKEVQFCPVGSVKANIGHSESAAGIAGVAKVLLQLKHRQLVPSINSEEVNPNINFARSPFYLQHELTEWKSISNQPRRALVNSFGAGGVNACVVLEEFDNQRISEAQQDTNAHIATISAKNHQQLLSYVDRIIAYLEGEVSDPLADICYTLQVGREAMEERLALVISDKKELIHLLKEWRKDKLDDKYCMMMAIYHSNKTEFKEAKSQLAVENELVVRAATKLSDMRNLAELWSQGREVNWDKLYEQVKPLRVSLPNYPFIKERYWVSDNLSANNRSNAKQSNAQLHPLISNNSSNMREVSFSSLLSDNDFFSVDHKVNNENILPGSCYLEIACMAGTIAAEQKVHKLKDIIWAQPLSFKSGAKKVKTILKSIGECIEYEIISYDQDKVVIPHSEGRICFEEKSLLSIKNDNKLSIQDLKRQSTSIKNGREFYKSFESFGFNYGLSFQTIKEIYINDRYVLSKLELAAHLKDDFGQFILHPSIIDGALQTLMGLVGEKSKCVTYLPFAIDELVIFHAIPQLCYVHVELAHIQKADKNGLQKFNVNILNEQGNIVIQISNFYVRQYKKSLDTSKTTE